MAAWEGIQPSVSWADNARGKMTRAENPKIPQPPLGDTNPQALAAELDGRLFVAVVDRAEAERLRTSLQVISARIAAGRTEIRVLADAAPPGTRPAVPTLEDVYFATLIAHGVDTSAE